jgi:hypothetical protein
MQIQFVFAAQPSQKPCAALCLQSALGQARTQFGQARKEMRQGNRGDFSMAMDVLKRVLNGSASAV